MTQPPYGGPAPRDQVQFERVRFREAYDKAEVDAFLQRVHRALEARDGSVTAKDVDGVRFKPRRIGGYDMAQVDDELQRLAAALREIEQPEGELAPPVDVDDLLEMHEFLESFDGDFKSLFRDMPKG